MTREQSKCKTCRFFDAVDDQQGTCRVDAPLMTKSGDGIWPMIFNYDWCGKHRPFFKVVHTPIGAMMKPVEEGDE